MAEDRGLTPSGSPFRLRAKPAPSYHAYSKTSGTGHLYQGRFKSFPIQSDEHLLIAMRYVERNPDDPPLPRHWRSWVNKAESDAEVKALRHCIQRRLPFGDDRWIKRSTVRLNLESTTRPRGRPRNET